MDLQSTRFWFHCFLRLTEENSCDLSVFLSFYRHAVMFSNMTKLLIRFLSFHFTAEEIRKATKPARLLWKNDKERGKRKQRGQKQPSRIKARAKVKINVSVGWIDKKILYRQTCAGSMSVTCYCWSATKFEVHLANEKHDIKACYFYYNYDITSPSSRLTNNLITWWR